MYEPILAVLLSYRTREAPIPGLRITRETSLHLVEKASRLHRVYQGMPWQEIQFGTLESETVTLGVGVMLQ